MTVARSTEGSDRPELRPSTLPFDPADLVAMRVLPAQFARMVGVSKQAVSKWIQHGTVTLGPDGKLDPAVASRQVIERTDPARLRARVFKQAVSGHENLRQRVRALEAELAGVRETERNQKDVFVHVDDLGEFIHSIVAKLVEFGFAERLDEFEEWLDEASEPLLFPWSTGDAASRESETIANDTGSAAGAADSRETTPAPPAPTQEN